MTKPIFTEPQIRRINAGKKPRKSWSNADTYRVLGRVYGRQKSMRNRLAHQMVKSVPFTLMVDENGNRTWPSLRLALARAERLLEQCCG